MNALRVMLILMLLALTVYTIIVIADYGMVLFQVFFGDMARMNWAGQFNLDFMLMLMLSALWVSWRHHFSAAGLALGVAAFFGGAGFLGVYLLTQTFLTEGNVSEMLIGDRTNA